MANVMIRKVGMLSVERGMFGVACVLLRSLGGVVDCFCAMLMWLMLKLSLLRFQVLQLWQVHWLCA